MNVECHFHPENGMPKNFFVELTKVIEPLTGTLQVIAILHKHERCDVL